MSHGFSLIETMRFEPGTGILRRNLHAARLRNSAKVLGFAGAEQALAALDEATVNAANPLRLRLELFADGRHDTVLVFGVEKMPKGIIGSVYFLDRERITELVERYWKKQ